jgi:alanyl-tRNA synthetase
MKAYTTAKIRQLFLDYFARHNHTVVESSSLVPASDPTLFFTNAGMVQFKGVFLGQEKRTFSRAVTAQRCLRASGKHNDLEMVGYTNRHHTFFEMLGNFSFGDYFKTEAIHYAWDFLTKELAIEPSRLWVTVHEKDMEAAKLWEEEFKKTKTKAQGLSFCGDKDNFWAMGETGPCGYCSEIFYDHGENFIGDPPGGKNEGERYVEIWNLVFMQFERDGLGKLKSLPKPSVDTGMGLERIAAVMQGVNDNYAIDVFSELHDAFINLLQTKGDITKTKNNAEDIRIASRVVVDHIRAAVCLIADGVLPANEGRGYVLRSIIRRAIYYLYRVGVTKPLFFQMVYPFTKLFNDSYKGLGLSLAQDQIAATIEREEVKFLDTLDRGLKIFNNEITKIKDKTIPGKIAFNLHDTYGLPVILTTELARERGFILDKEGFEAEMAKQRELSRKLDKTRAPLRLDLPALSATTFVGYTENNCSAKICGLFNKEGEPFEYIKQGEAGIIILDKTPFYAEAGGQVGDSGEIQAGENNIFIVEDTQKQGGFYLHYGRVAKGSFKTGVSVNAQIDIAKRQKIKLNHSATHLLHNSLREVLGEHVKQRGSLVNEERLRFDFIHTASLTTNELTAVEQLVNAKIRELLGVKTEIKSIAQAKKEGAHAFFDEKYGEEVRVISMGEFSKELCGGTHLANTGEIGLFKIVSEIGIAAGVRRIEALTGEDALRYFEKIEADLKGASKMLGVGLEQVIDKINQLTEEGDKLAKEMTRLKSDIINNQNKDLAKNATNVNGVWVLAVKVPEVDKKAMRQMADRLRGQLSPAIIVLASVNNGKVQIMIAITLDLIDKFDAREVLEHINKQIGGGGGGRKDMAEGGGSTDVSALDAALESVLPWIRKKV